MPMIVFDPRAEASRRGLVEDDLVLNIDVAPTLLEVAGVQPPPDLQGRSLVAQLLGHGKPLLGDIEGLVGAELPVQSPKPLDVAQETAFGHHTDQGDGQQHHAHDEGREQPPLLCKGQRAQQGQVQLLPGDRSTTEVLPLWWHAQPPSKRASGTPMRWLAPSWGGFSGCAYLGTGTRISWIMGVPRGSVIA